MQGRVGPRENTRLSNWWPAHAGHAAPPIVDVPLAQGKQMSLLHHIYIPSTLLRTPQCKDVWVLARTTAHRIIVLAPITFKTRLSNWWPAHAGHAAPPIVDVPLAQGKQVCPANLARCHEGLIFFFAGHGGGGAPKQRDGELNPNSPQSTAAAPTNAGDHGSDWFCFCS
ncbi:hypothetical protein K503DRAFT_785829 [Rhizopogon vinicolor AM-OR11-026]|uniref:Uncharacterized protein n=1 Tax=Rhizopogon vinicolor AM-OR11-026 TaxID=1314800 RepID=A0A1B7MP25_9AGAM|nr:hypothetical protein K503DRAFT_785829 [Rhizopogon vinicolor AM-OR11-026]